MHTISHADCLPSADLQGVVTAAMPPLAGSFRQVAGGRVAEANRNSFSAGTQAVLGEPTTENSNSNATWSVESP
jgi:hypothetical protein